MRESNRKRNKAKLCFVVLAVLLLPLLVLLLVLLCVEEKSVGENMEEENAS